MVLAYGKTDGLDGLGNERRSDFGPGIRVRPADKIRGGRNVQHARLGQHLVSKQLERYILQRHSDDVFFVESIIGAQHERELAMEHDGQNNEEERKGKLDNEKNLAKSHSRKSRHSPETL